MPLKLRIVSKPPKKQPGGHLMELPTELRTKIYEYMFPNDKVDVYAIKGSLHKAEAAHYVAGEHVSILATCRTVYNEAKPVLYSRTEFCIHVRDGYWQHFWSREAYEDEFVIDYDTSPSTDAWMNRNPWLADPRSIVTLRNARTLTLNLMCNKDPRGQRRTWTAQLRHNLREAANIQKLHISLQAPHDLQAVIARSLRNTDVTLKIIGQDLKCGVGGTVTGEMDLQLGSIKFDSTSYYKMLAMFKGVDITANVFRNRLYQLKRTHARLLLEISQHGQSLKSKTAEYIRLIDLSNESYDYEQITNVLTQFDDDVNEITTEMLSAHKQLHLTKQDMESLQSNFKGLKTRHKTVNLP